MDDPFTNPPRHTYELLTTFNMPTEQGSIPAVALTARHANLVLAAYPLLIQFLLLAVWKLLSSLILAIYPLGKGTKTARSGQTDTEDLKGWLARYVVIIAFWNSVEPMHASGTMLWYFKKTVFAKLPGRLLSGSLFVISSVMAFGGIAFGILYTSRISVGNAAPVAPSVLYLPKIPTIGNGVELQHFSFHRPSFLRAIGSAEAFDLNSKATSIYIQDRFLPTTNNTHPQVEIKYRYSITGRDFGLQNHLSLSFQVSGQCTTEYSWLRSGPLITLDAYYMWNKTDTAHTAFAPSSKYTQPGLLGIQTVRYESTPEEYDVESSNHTFGFIVRSAGVGSYTPSTDAWYYTEPVPPNSTPELWLGASQRVKSGRPVLSCWENLNLCYNGVCGFKNLTNSKNLPNGTLLPLADKISPVVSRIVLQAGVSSLRVYSGSNSGQFIDAGSGSMKADLQRLVLAAYLLTKESYRNIALNDRLDKDNAFEDGNSKLLPGAADFVMRTTDVTALRIDMLIIPPCLLCGFWIIYGLLMCMKRSPSASQGQRNRQGFFMKLHSRGIAFSAPQLFRMLHVASNGNATYWRSWRKSASPTSGICDEPAATIEWSKTSGSWIEFLTNRGNYEVQISKSSTGATTTTALPTSALPTRPLPKSQHHTATYTAEQPLVNDISPNGAPRVEFPTGETLPEQSDTDIPLQQLNRSPPDSDRDDSHEQLFSNATRA